MNSESGKMKSNGKKRFVLKGKTAVFIDWANVYGWTKSLKNEVDAEKLFSYLKSYSEIVDIRLYFGEDEHPKSKEFLKKSHEAGYTVITKPVKNILITEIEGKKIYRRKCDFDMEVCINVHAALRQDFESFIFFTGDGDYEPLYKMIIGQGKQVIIVYTKGHLGKEIWAMKQGIFKVELINIINIDK